MAISELPEILSWTAPAEVLVKSYSNYQRRLMVAWGRALMRILQADRQLGQSLLDKARCLPQDAFRRFLTAPEVACWLNGYAAGGRADSTGDFFGDALDAEYYRLGRKAECSRAVWSALGDWYFPQTNLNGSASGQQDAWQPLTQWKLESVFSAPCTANGIPVDFSSPLARSSSLEKWYGPYTCFTAPETRLVMRRLDQAIEGVAQSSAETENFIKLFTRVIVLRKNLNQPSRTISRSLSQYIGATVLENPQNDMSGPVTLTESLVHEAIHHMLYALELQQPFVSDTEEARDWRRVSPWTGNEIKLRQYLHACLVWFGLWSFWNLCTSSDAFPEERIQEGIARTASGFRKAPLMDSLSRLSSLVPLDLQSVIGQLQEIVLREPSVT